MESSSQPVVQSEIEEMNEPDCESGEDGQPGEDVTVVSNIERQILETRARRMRTRQLVTIEEGEEEDFVNCDNDENLSSMSDIIRSIDKITKTGTNGNLEVLDELHEESTQIMEKPRPVASISPCPVKIKSPLSEILLPVLPVEEMTIENTENWDAEPEVGTYRPPSFTGIRIQRVGQIQEDLESENQLQEDLEFGNQPQENLQPENQPQEALQPQNQIQEEPRVAIVATAVEVRSKKTGTKKKKRSPNYQFTPDDYFTPNDRSRSPSPIFGPANIVRRFPSQPENYHQGQPERKDQPATPVPKQSRQPESRQSKSRQPETHHQRRP